MRTKKAQGQTAICVNGKWLAQPASGTQRYATEVMQAISGTPTASNVTLAFPKDAVVPPWATNFRLVRSRFRGIIFEQLALLWHARGKHLYSLAGPAPVAKRNQTLVMHDATMFRYPDTFRLPVVVWYRVMHGVLCRSAKRVLTVSSFSRSELAITLRVPESRFELAPCAADHVDQIEPIWPRQQLQLLPRSFALIVGNFAPHKNIAAAATALAKADVPVAVVGGAHHVFRALKLEDHKNMHLLGRVDDRQLMGLYVKAAVLVAPSRYEGFCVPIIEAGRLGCPTVFATGSAMTEVAGDGGFGFDTDDMDQCIELVKQIMFDRKLRDILGTRARANADRFSWTRTAQTIFAPEIYAPAAGVDATPSLLRVLHVTETFSAGVGTAIIAYANAIRGQGVESSLLAQDRGFRLLEELDGSSPFVSARIVPPGRFNLWRAIGATVEELRPDIVHLHSSWAGGIGRLRLALRDKPVVVYSPRCFAFERRDISRLQHWAYRSAEFLLARRTAAFICVTPREVELARQFRSHAEVFHVANTFAPNPPLPADHIARVAESEACAVGPPLRVVTVGRVWPQKDPEMFVQIISALRASGPVEATWVGDGEDRAKAALERTGVAVTGWLPARDVPRVMAEYTVYLHTAGWEGMPIAVLEAMVAGVPVVVRRNPCYRLVLPDGWQFDDAASAVRLIRELAEEPQRRRRIKEQFDLIAELRKSSPDTVLAAYYREIFRKSSSDSAPTPVASNGIDQLPDPAT
jgi:glycosyltransferase involved in cell wall biosynthesis